MNHACPNTRNNGTAVSELAANRKERRNGKTDQLGHGRRPGAEQGHVADELEEDETRQLSL
jgi:hypothetical protein